DRRAAEAGRPDERHVDRDDDDVRRDGAAQRPDGAPAGRTERRAVVHHRPRHRARAGHRGGPPGVGHLLRPRQLGRAGRSGLGRRRPGQAEGALEHLRRGMASRWTGGPQRHAHQGRRRTRGVLGQPRQQGRLVAQLRQGEGHRRHARRRPRDRHSL
ncbi:MAG: Pyridoxamine 5'-phosphate oxidase, partial [uncultured Nocardioidaceae bacterium]